MSGTKFKDGLVSGDEIKSEGDISTSGSGVKIKANSTSTKLISMHHDTLGGHISATERLDIDSPLLNLYRTNKLILSGDATETKLYHSNDGTVKLATEAQGITVYGSNGVTAKRFKFPVLEDDASPAVGSTANTDYALIQAQKIGTAVGETSVFDFSLGDNRSNDKTLRDEFRFRFKSGGVNSGNEYSLMDIGANNDGCTILDLTTSHNLTGANAETSEVKAGFFRGKADTVDALTGLDTDDLSEGTGKLYFTTSRARDAVSAAAAAASGGGSLSYNSATGVFTYTPPALSSFLTSSTVPVASTTTIGGMKLTSDVDQTVAANGVSATANRTYAVQLDSSNKGVVNVPWSDTDTNTTYSAAATNTLGLIKIGYTTADKKYAVLLDANKNAYVSVPWTDTQPNTYAAGLNQHLKTTSNVVFNNAETNILTMKGTAAQIRFSDTDPSAANVNKNFFVIDQTNNYLSLAATNNAFGSFSHNIVCYHNGTTQLRHNSSTKIATGSTGVVVTGDVYSTGHHIINNSAPTLYLQDTNHRSAMVHVNSNLFYILRANGTNTTAYDQGVLNGRWPMYIDMASTNNAYFGGEVNARTDVVAYASDERLKENIVPIPNALEKVSQLKGCTFDWKDKVDELGFTPTYRKNDVGLIAQDVEKVLPQLVTLAPFDNYTPDPDSKEDQSHLLGTSKSGEDYKTVKYDRVVALLVEAINELKAEVDELKKNK